MKKRLIFVGFLIFVSMAGVGSAQAAWQNEIPVDRTNGSTLPVPNPGTVLDQITATDLSPIEGELLSTVDMILQAEWMMGFGPMAAPVAGTLDMFNAGGFGSASETSGDELGTFSFDAGSVSSGNMSFNFNVDHNLFSGGVDFDTFLNTPSSPVGDGGDAVPLPSALWFMGSGLVGILFTRGKSA